MNDELITHIDLCCQGDTKAFGFIVEEYRQLVYVLAFRLLCDEEDARDITQEIFIKVWQNISKYNRKYKFSTWIYKIASHACYDKLRVERKMSKVNLADCELYSDGYPDEILNNKELKKLIIGISAGLTPKQKLVFTLSDLEELEVEEISVITGMTPAKIKSNLYLARKYIKSKISNDER
jgi:RNA polymerase sigma factor, sigma-70 family